MAILDDSSSAHFHVELAGGAYDREFLSVVRFELVEQLSTPFCVKVDLACRDAGLDFDRIVGAPARFHMHGPQGDRDLFGIATRLRQSDHTRHHAFYSVEIQPALWRLTQRQTSRIFQDKDLEQIVTRVLEGAGLVAGRDFRFALQAKHPARECCVQYQESDFAFVSRLLEEEGVFYFFEQQERRSVLVVADSAGVHTDIEGDRAVRFAPRTRMHAHEAGRELEQVTELALEQSVRPGAYTATDFRFEQPTLDLLAGARTERDADLEIYEYPSEVVEYRDLSVREQ
ncbi:MAG: type VI secretion system tip protein VgrG, partial [Planctomycetes bacterium]|nr:type VI secretion system tip protein VgrG [Planctomycetota bacterium]